MVDKGFLIEGECAARHIYLRIPPGKRGKSQLPKSEIKKTKKIANVRILIEQVIRRIKTFRILSQEIPITLLSHIDDIVTICAAISNFHQSIYVSWFYAQKN